ncbi:hypothetical protein TcWFU_006885 [Taenia crassiceps]|uniref:Uncharacterized protein n=1 Tax=Taenia crassiceps TaxID=6207 RepID=A0ABR4QDV4_9CEST
MGIEEREMQYLFGRCDSPPASASFSSARMPILMAPPANPSFLLLPQTRLSHSAGVSRSLPLPRLALKNACSHAFNSSSLSPFPPSTNFSSSYGTSDSEVNYPTASVLQ